MTPSSQQEVFIENKILYQINIVFKRETFSAAIRNAKAVDINRPQVVTLDNRSCLTYDRQQGTCLPVKDCYPYTKLHKELSNLETWVIGHRGSCNYVESDGQQVTSATIT